MVDKPLLLRKLSELDEYLRQIREYSGTTVEAYHEDWKTQRIVERTLQVMIEICVDVANHIIADEQLRIPKSYSDTFKVLEEAGVLEKGVSEIMQEMAKFRNVIVHGYDKVDEAIVVAVLNRRLEDFVTFRDAVVAFLGKSAR